MLSNFERQRKEKAERTTEMIISNKPNDCFSKIGYLPKDSNLKKEVTYKKSDIMTIYDRSFIIYDGFRFKNPTLPLHRNKDFNKAKTLRKLNQAMKAQGLQRSKFRESIPDFDNNTLMLKESYMKNRGFRKSSLLDPIGNFKKKSSYNISNIFLTTLNTNSTVDCTKETISSFNRRPTENDFLKTWRGGDSKINKFYLKKTREFGKSLHSPLNDNKSSDQENNSFYQTQKLFKLNRDKLMSSIEGISYYNSKVGSAIGQEAEDETLKIHKIIKSNKKEENLLRPEEIELLKLQQPVRKNLVAEIKLNRGSTNYISEDKANLFKISDAVWRMNDGSCYNFRKMVFSKYDEVAEMAENLDDYRLQRFLKEHPVKSDRMYEKNCQIKFIKKSMYDTYRNALNLRVNFVREKKDKDEDSNFPKKKKRMVFRIK